MPSKREAADVPRSPEPCFGGRCWSPVACECHGYCRNRSVDHLPTEAEGDAWRADALERATNDRFQRSAAPAPLTGAILRRAT